MAQILLLNNNIFNFLYNYLHLCVFYVQFQDLQVKASRPDEVEEPIHDDPAIIQVFCILHKE